MSERGSRCTRASQSARGPIVEYGAEYPGGSVTASLVSFPTRGYTVEVLIEVNATFINLNEFQKNILQWKNQNLLNLSEVGLASNGVFDLSDVKNKLLQWKTQKLAALCPSNGAKLQNLLNLVCSTAQPTNVTLRDACITCFSQVTSLPEGPQELNALSVCATQYFVNTSYANCATTLANKTKIDKKDASQRCVGGDAQQHSSAKGRRRLIGRKISTE
ncbi:unnamed protein product [Diatraea saccharalis]|uniref:Uncharacterized protein n=1 Tax=Diatraea saccharalis TaxID=40085 RepID=A0A9N9R9G7_9NEOP|nr:unnamed protein product [Diatraea saccharalis]